MGAVYGAIRDTRARYWDRKPLKFIWSMLQLSVDSQAGSFMIPFMKNFFWAAARKESRRVFHFVSPFVCGMLELYDDREMWGVRSCRGRLLLRGVGRCYMSIRYY